MRELQNALPDDRALTDVCIVDDNSKCPAGYQIVSKTYDQDTDADLWRDGFLGKKITRYLCLSKTEGKANFVIENIKVVNDKETPPEGFTLVSHVHNSDQKALKKKLLFIKLVPLETAKQAVTDVIVLSKSKRAPKGFQSAGELSSMVICFKLGTPKPANNTMTQSCTSPLANSSRPSSNHLPYPVTPLGTSNSSSASPPSLYPIQQLQQSGGPAPPVPPRVYMTWGGGGRKVAPPRPPSAILTSSAADTPHRSIPAPPVASTLYNPHYGLDGVPFQLNPRLAKAQANEFQILRPPPKSVSIIDAEYSYDFTTERQALQKLPPNVSK